MSERPPKQDSWTPPRSAPRRAAQDAFHVRASQLTGALIGSRYKVLGCLSRGDASRVDLAEDLETNALVAIKTLSAAAAHDEARNARIEAAIRSEEPLHHPNAVELLGVGKTPAGVPYLVMEALPGVTLDELLRQRQRLPVDLSLVVARQAALALAALHESGVLHGDVTPSNLFVLGAPEEPYGVKLLNYGVARCFRALPAEPVPALNPEYTYFPPERLLGDGCEARSDVYGLGVVLLACLAGRAPFQCENQVHALYRQLFAPILEGSGLDATLEPKLAAVVTNAARKHPENRYSDAAELLTDLEAVLGLSGRAVVSRTPLHSRDVYEPRTEGARLALEHIQLAHAELTRGEV